MKKRIYRAVAGLLCITIIFSVLFSNTITTFADNSISSVATEEKMVCNSKDGTLSLYIDNMGHFELRNNTSGKSWYSIPQDTDRDNISSGLTVTDICSELIIEYLPREDENTQFSSQISNSSMMCENGGSIKVSKIDNGFKVIYYFEEIDIEIPILYKLVGSRFDVSVDIEGINEGKNSYLVSLSVLPYFGAAGAEKQGYLFIPDGCGAIAEFNQNIKPLKSYEKQIYGNDAAHSDEAKTSEETEIKLPVFGLVYDNNALMGIVSKGDGAASLLAKTGSDDVYYNSINSKMIYRICSEDTALYRGKTNTTIYSLTHTEFGIPEYTVSYYSLFGNDASYSGMARKYKEYLAETYSLEQKKTTSSLAIRAYGAIEEQKNFLGIKYYKKIPLTTYIEMQNILKDLNKNGVKDIAVQYIGWSGDGYTNRKLPLDVNALSVLGGKKDLKSLKKYTKDNNLEFYLDSDLLNFKKSGNGVSARRNGTKAPNGDTAKIYKYSMVTYLKDESVPPNYLLGIKYLDKCLRKYLKKYDKWNMNSISLSTFGNTIYSDFKSGSGTYRTKNILTIQEQLDNLTKDYDNIALTGGNAYTIPFVDRIYEVPVASSGYDIFAYDVPFYQMVVSGFATYTTPPAIQSVDFDTMFLKAVETGSDLLFDCVYTDSSVLRDTELADSFSSQYSIWKEKAIDSYEKIKSIDEKINGSTIKQHERIFEGVYCTEYENGIKIYVNYNNKSVSAEGVSIEAQSYAVKEVAK